MLHQAKLRPSIVGNCFIRKKMQREKCFSPSLLLLLPLVFLSPKSSHLQSSLLRTFLIRRAHNRFTLPFIINVERITLLQGGKLGSILDCCCCYCSFAVWWRCALADSGCQRGTHCCCYYESSRQGPWQQWSAFAKLVILFWSHSLSILLREPVLEIFTISSHSLSRRKCHSQSYGGGCLVSAERWIIWLSLGFVN